MRPRIRRMTAADADAVAAVHVAAWRWAYAGLMPQPHLDALSVAAGAERRRRLLAGDDGSAVRLVAEQPGTGAVIGFTDAGPYRDDGAGHDPPPGDGELYTLYVHPDHVGTGAGRALLAEALARTSGRGWHRLRLWVVAGNARARRFYERAGFRPDGAEDPYVVDGVPVPEIRYALGLDGGGPDGGGPEDAGPDGGGLEGAGPEGGP